MRRLLVVLAGSALLAACGGGAKNDAVQACEKAIAEKLAGKNFALDRTDMQSKLQKQSDTAAQINSTVVFDKGLPGETKQTFECRVSMDPANPAAEPAVTFLQFTW